MKKRIWLDSINLTCVTKEQLDHLINKGYTLVISNTAIDVKIFQENIGWFEEQVEENSTIRVEILQTTEEMIKKPFFWSSCQQETAPAATLEEAVTDLPNAETIIALEELVELCGNHKGGWKMFRWSPSAPLTEEIARILGIEKEKATRTAVLAAAKAVNRMDLFDEYNIQYNRGLAIQHCCDAILKSDGTLTEI